MTTKITTAEAAFAEVRRVCEVGGSPDLHGADLHGANLHGADLHGADLRWADLHGANLHGASGGVLQITDLPSDQVIATPTLDGWHVVVGCWSGTPAELVALCDAPDEDWPEARGDERQRREPVLRAAHALIEAHITYHAGLIEELAEKWKKAEK